MDWTPKEAMSNIIAMARATVQKAARGTISEQQQNTLKNPTIKGPIWNAKFTLPPPPEDNICRLLLQTIDKYNEHQVPYARPESRPIKMEWAGFRKGVSVTEPAPQIS